MPDFVTEYPQIFTASIKGWYKLLQHDQYKDIIINSLRFLMEDKRLKFMYLLSCQSDSYRIISSSSRHVVKLYELSSLRMFIMWLAANQGREDE